MAAPTYEQLIAFAAGELPARQAAAVAAHVQEDPEAAAVVSAWRTASETLRRDDSVAPSSAAVQRARAIFAQRAAMASSTSRVAGWIEGAQRFLAQLVYDSRVQPAAVRFAGEDDRINLTFETEEGDIDVQAERLHDEDSIESRWRVVGQVSDSDAAGGRREVALVRRDQAIPVVLAATDEHGGFALETQGGAYELLIRSVAKTGAQTTAAERIIVLSPVELPG